MIDQSSRYLVGITGNRERFRRVTARAYGHGEMAATAKTFSGGILPAPIVRSLGTLTIPASLQDLAELFVKVQDLRHLADYDLATTFLRGIVLDLIGDVEQAIQDWETYRNDPAAQFFLICLLIWERIRNK